MDRGSDYPSFRQAIWLLILVVLLILVLSGVAGTVAFVARFPPNHPGIVAAVNLVAIGLALAWGVSKTRTPAAKALPLGPLPVAIVLPLVVTVIGAVILLSDADNLLRTVLPIPPAFAEFLAHITGAGGSRWGSILALVIVAPLTEELLFRGLILRGFLRHYATRKAIIASALLFGAFHLNPWQFLGATVLGVLFAWVFVRTRSLLLCMFGHAAANGLPIIVVSLFHLDIQGFTGGLSRVEFQPLWLDALGVVLAGMGLWLLTRAFGSIEAQP